MAFKDILNRYSNLLNEQEPVPADAAAPAPQAAQPQQLPADNSATQGTVPPEGYVDMVRLLAKALVMNVPTGSIDALFTEPVTKENAIAVREGLQNSINTSETYEDNPQRLENIHFKSFVNSINENNFMSKYKEILSVMKKYSNDPKLP